MRNKKTVTKKLVSFAAGGALLASLYANAVYVPQNHQATQNESDKLVQAILAGDSEFVSTADGFQVAEVSGRSAVEELTEQIALLEKEISDAEAAGVTVLASNDEQVLAAYSAETVKRTAQTPEELASVALTADGKSFPGKDSFVRQISRITGLSLGVTIGRLAQILADPFLSAAAVELVVASNNPGGLAAVISTGGGVSATQNSVLVALGVSTLGGVAGGASASSSGGTVGVTAGTSPNSSTADAASS